MTMPDAPPDPKGFSLRRWSQRKHAAARGEPDPAVVADARGAPPAANADGADTRARPADASAPDLSARADSSRAATADADASPHGDRAPLPPLDTLTIDSDYTPFMQPGVDDAVKRGALRKLFSDPRFNVMDGLDVYIDDYSKPDPISAEMVAGLAQARYIFDPPVTRVDEHGYVVDVPPPPDEPAAQAEASSDGLPGTSSDANNTASAEAIASPEPAATLPPEGSPVESEVSASPADVPKPSGAPDPK
jgi:hypothetical protein